ncbi:MAG: hypothetical protein NHB32_17025 [Fischerella sp. CENA71]|nr:hypothetical protein [Fischerella sp. CENA71]
MGSKSATSRGAVWLEPSGGVRGDVGRGDRLTGAGVGHRRRPQCRLHRRPHHPAREAIRSQASGGVRGDAGRGDQLTGAGHPRSRHRPRSRLSTRLSTWFPTFHPPLAIFRDFGFLLAKQLVEELVAKQSAQD